MCVPKKLGGMGFRDLFSFNMAMLSKQTWRLLNNPDSLCAQVLRAKYYPDGKLLNAGPKKALLTPGRAFLQDYKLLSVDTFGELAQEKKLTFGRTIGSQIVIPGKFLPGGETVFCVLLMS